MLKKFSEMLAAGSGGKNLNQPPYAIKAGDLDKNFELCHPLPVDGNNAAYTIDRSVDGGFRLRGQRIFNVCENGRPVQYLFFAELLEDVGT